MSRGGAAKVVETACGPVSDVGVLPRERMGRYEIEMVQQKRRTLRASWQDCANMVGRSVHDVRLACDPGYRPEVEFERADRVSAKVRLTDDERAMLNAVGKVTMLHAQRQRSRPEGSVTELRGFVDVGPMNAGRAMGQLCQRGFVTAAIRDQVNYWRFTVEGRAAWAVEHG